MEWSFPRRSESSRRRTPAAVGAVLAAALMTAGTLAAPAPAATELVASARLSPAGVYQKQAFDATNAQRTKNDRVALKQSTCLQRFAAKQAANQASRRKMYHQSLSPIMSTCGLNLAGENVAYGFKDGKSLVNAWMHSSGHRANILNGKFKLIGLAARQSSDGTWYVSQVFGRAR